MKVIFRVDSSLQIGTGHVMRCLTLADALREHGAKCHFVCRALEGNLTELVATRGHEVTRLPAPRPDFVTEHTQRYAAWLGVDWETDALETGQVLCEQHCDWLIVDHYALDYRWEQALRARVSKIMVIDDLANRRHDCDLLLDQNLGRNEADYGRLLPSTTTMLIGPHYALLRPEFSRLRPYSLERRSKPILKRILITSGGVDKDNITCKLLDALKASDLLPGVEITVIMGQNAPWLADVELLAATLIMNVTVLTGVSNVAELMSNCDLIIGATGSTSWERCCLGVPAVMTIIAENQRMTGEILQHKGTGKLIDRMKSMGPQIDSIIKTIFRDGKTHASYVSSAQKITDGNGAIRVRECITLLQ